MISSEKVLKERDQIDNKYKWNMEAMYSDENIWESDFSEGLSLAENFASFAGRLSESAITLADAYEQRDRIWQTIERVYVYAHMKKDEDNRNSRYQAMIDKCQSLIAKASAAMSFFTPELLAIPEDIILNYIKDEPRLHTYEFAIKDTLREKEHVLSPAEEKIIAQLSEVVGSSQDIFTMLNNADMKFGEITDEDGEKVELTHGNFITFMESHNREVRKEAFDAKYKPYKDFVNTIATVYNTNVKADAIGAKIRKFPSALEASLSSGNIPKEVYTSLVDTVHEYLPALHKYMKIRKRILGVDELHMYDLYVPLIKLPKTDIPYEQSVEMITKTLNIMGNDYVSKMTEGINQGWIDVYENKGKTSGAYSYGSYDSYPYILMNYSNTLKDVFTLIHEMGHSMHSLYTRANQPFIYGSHSIFTAEVASTVNENLLMKQLLADEKDPEMRKYLLNLHIEEFRTTLFRQTMFAEFEKLAHEAVESGEVLTAEWLCDTYAELNKEYFGEDVVIDDNIKYEWARIPHFYTSFYVYMYATGYSAASAISDLIIEGAAGNSDENKARDNYIEFLKSGECDHPIELLKIAGVDMGTKEPVQRAMKIFAELIDEFDELTK